jgi:hypothetical protein
MKKIAAIILENDNYPATRRGMDETCFRTITRQHYI